VSTANVVQSLPCIISIHKQKWPVLMDSTTPAVLYRRCKNVRSGGGAGLGARNAPTYTHRDGVGRKHLDMEAARPAPSRTVAEGEGVQL